MKEKKCAWLMSYRIDDKEKYNFGEQFFESRTKLSREDIDFVKNDLKNRLIKEKGFGEDSFISIMSLIELRAE